MFLVKLALSILLVIAMLVVFGFFVFAALFPEIASRFIRWVVRGRRRKLLIDEFPDKEK